MGISLRHKKYLSFTFGLIYPAFLGVFLVGIFITPDSMTNINKAWTLIPITYFCTQFVELQQNRGEKLLPLLIVREYFEIFLICQILVTAGFLSPVINLKLPSSIIFLNKESAFFLLLSLALLVPVIWRGMSKLPNKRLFPATEKFWIPETYMCILMAVLFILCAFNLEHALIKIVTSISYSLCMIFYIYLLYYEE